MLGEDFFMQIFLPDVSADPGRCFSIDIITLKTLDGEVFLFGAGLVEIAQQP